MNWDVIIILVLVLAIAFILYQVLQESTTPLLFAGAGALGALLFL